MSGQIPLFGLGISAKSPYVTAKMLTNLYCETRPQGEKSMLVAYGTPGTTLFVDLGDTPPRGGLEFPSTNLAYVVHRGTLWEVNNAGVKTNRGTLLTTTGRVSMDHNGVQIMITDGTAGYIFNTSTNVFVQILDPDFPANPVTCCYLGRRFIANFLNSSRFYVSDVDDGINWNALNFANAETSPDPIKAVWQSNGQLILPGTLTTEFWGLSGTLDFPFVLLQGTATEWGLAATWSIAKYDNTFACLIKNRMGQVMVAKMSGYLPQRISTPDLDAIINAYATTADASSYSYMLGGHPMFVISFPTAGKTWLYDGLTGFWSPLKGFGITRHRGEFAFNFIERTVLADYSNGHLYNLDGNALTDNGSPIEREIVGETITMPDGSFFQVDCLRLDMETGVGTTTGQGSNPQIALSVSRDNGKTYGPEMWTTMGAKGEYGTIAEWRRLGSPRYFTPKIKFTDPVAAVFVNACLNPES